MTVEQITNGVVYVGTVAGALSGIGLFLHYAMVRPLRGFLRREIVANLVDISHKLDANTSETQALGQRLTDHLNDAADRDARIAEISQRLSEHTRNGGHLTH